jgi:hypothetical protein
LFDSFSNLILLKNPSLISLVLLSMFFHA